MLAQDPGSKGPNGGVPPVNLAAQAFGIPSSYDPGSASTAPSSWIQPVCGRRAERLTSGWRLWLGGPRWGRVGNNPLEQRWVGERVCL